MRQIFSIRFFAAVGAVVGLFFLLTTVFATREVIEGDDDAAPAVQLRDVDFVEQVFSATNPSFALDDEGIALNDTELIIDGQRRVRIVAGTPGESHCDVHGDLGTCAVVADLLGEGVVWFALIPDGSGTTIELPAIDVLEDGRATLVNGWRLPFAPVLDRRCREDGEDVEFSSYQEFREVMGDDFTSVYDTVERRLVAVECRTRVPFAPDPVPTTTTTSSTSTTTTTNPAAPASASDVSTPSP